MEMIVAKRKKDFSGLAEDRAQTAIEILRQIEEIEISLKYLNQGQTLN